MLNATNTKKQGDIGLGGAIAWFVAHGYTVSIPLTDSQPYDLIVDKNKLLRVQVKTTSRKSKYGKYITQLSVKGGNKTGTGKVKPFNCNEVDSVFILTAEGDRYLIPSECIEAEHEICLGDKYSAFRVHCQVGLEFGCKPNALS